MKRWNANSLRTIRLTVHVCEGIKLVLKTASLLETQFEREVSDLEIAQYLSAPPEFVRRIREYMRLLSPSSFDAWVGDDSSDTTLGDIIADERSENPAEIAGRNELREALYAVLRTLTPRQRKVLELRFGLNGYDSHTLQEVGDKYNLTRESIRQIAKQAFECIRKCPPFAVFVNEVQSSKKSKLPPTHMLADNLQEVLDKATPPRTPEEALSVVASAYGTTTEEILTGKKSAKIFFVRYLFGYLLTCGCGIPPRSIKKYFTFGRSWAHVYNEKITSLMRRFPAVKVEVELLTQFFRRGAICCSSFKMK